MTRALGVLEILELFPEEDGTLSAPGIVRGPHLPRTTVHEPVTTPVARIPDGAEPAATTLDGITGPAAPREAPRGIRQRGVAVESRESGPDVPCVAAPVRDRTGEVVTALSVPVPAIRRSEERRAEPEQLAVRDATGLPERLGHRSTA
ncbi:hypothetical protein GCM10009549_43960 [Streptomyces thermoalcalitolerans]|uniref:IclR-ED domain-containing protein n=1 Tax=Streptomyces thermoalcalitolerans TaxID=65605 RepID=A0ABP3ZQE5_9ACTN